MDWLLVRFFDQEDVAEFRADLERTWKNCCCGQSQVNIGSEIRVNSENGVLPVLEDGSPLVGVGNAVGSVVATSEGQSPSAMLG